MAKARKDFAAVGNKALAEMILLYSFYPCGTQRGYQLLIQIGDIKIPHRPG